MVVLNTNNIVDCVHDHPKSRENALDKERNPYRPETLPYLDFVLPRLTMAAPAARTPPLILTVA